MSNMILETLHAVKGLDAVANAFAGTVRSDVVDMKNYGKALFIVHKGVGTTGTSTLTVEASDDAAASNVTAIPFRYKRCCNTATDAQGALTQATTAGFTTTAGSSEMYIIEVDARDLASTGYHYVSLKAVEVAAAAVLGGIVILLMEPRDTQAVSTTAVT